ncbi:hypothetical protein V2J09_023468 [Rumex salicifolius]
MAKIDRAARRQRILKGSEDRLALITGRLQDLSSLSPNASANFTAQSPPLVSGDRDTESRPKSRLQDKFVEETTQTYNNVGLACGGKQESNLHRHEPNYKPFKLSGSQHLIKTPLNFFGSISSKQLSIALAATEQSRMVLSITLALLVLMSQFEFPVFGYKMIRSIFLFRPLIFLLLTNTTLIVIRLLPDMKQEKVGGVLEVSLMVHCLLKAYFMDLFVYSLIIVCGFCLTS